MDLLSPEMNRVNQFYKLKHPVQLDLICLHKVLLNNLIRKVGYYGNSGARELSITGKKRKARPQKHPGLPNLSQSQNTPKSRLEKKVLNK